MSWDSSRSWKANVLQKLPFTMRLLVRFVGQWPFRWPLEIRYFGDWRESFRNRSFLPYPWLPFHLIEELDRYLEPSMEVFEWGSGSSTLFFARRVQRVVSVEHDPDWYEKVQNRIDKEELANVELRLVEPHSPVEGSPRFSSSKTPYRDCSFQEYVRSIRDPKTAKYDCVLVDGRSRSACLRESLDRLVSGGWLILDDSQRSRYGNALREAKQATRNYSEYSGLKPATLGRSRTSLFVKGELNG